MEQNTINSQVGLPIGPQIQKTPTTETPQLAENSTGITQSQTLDVGVVPTESNGNNVPKKKMSDILLISIILLILSIVVIAAFLLKNTIKLSTSNDLQTNTQSPTPTIVPKETLPPISIEGWKIYTNNVLKYTIRYPSDWSIDVSKAELPINGNNIQEISLYKGTYKLTIAWPTAYGPTICYFDDQPSSQTVSGGNFCRGEFVEYNGDNDLITYRRLISPNLKNDLQRWTIFTKSKNYFVGLPPIIMVAPKSYSEKEVSIMDKMLSTLTYLESYPYFTSTETATTSGSN